MYVSSKKMKKRKKLSKNGRKDKETDLRKLLMFYYYPDSILKHGGMRHENKN